MRLVPSLWANEWSYNTHSRLALFLTFVAYACYHVSRNATSIVKSVLIPDSHHLSSSSSSSSFPPLPWPLGPIFLPSNPLGSHTPTDGTRSMEPTSPSSPATPSGCTPLARLAAAPSSAYSAWATSDTSTSSDSTLPCRCLFQATGWPSVVIVVGNWLGEQGRGLLMGIWNAHTSVGNIVGSVLEDNVPRYG